MKMQQLEVCWTSFCRLVITITTKLQRSTELQLRIDILEAQKRDADESVVRLNESLVAARAELEKRLSERNQASGMLYFLR